jgi:membrane-associated phospholipid phosphatase
LNYCKKIFFCIKEKKQFFLLFFLFIFCALMALFFIGNEEFSHYVNGISTNTADTFFYFITYLGDGIFASLFLIFLLLFRLNIGVLSITVLIIPGMLTQILKRFCFPDFPRPSVVFNSLINNNNWHLIEGVDLHSYFSFPSGHTTTVFSICCLSILIIKNKIYHVPILILGVFTGFSRIYLSQHFLIDVFVGSIIGCLGSLLLYVAFKDLFFSSRWGRFSIFKLMLKK